MLCELVCDWGWKHLLGVVVKCLPMGWNGQGSTLPEKVNDLMLCSDIGPNRNLWDQLLKLKNVYAS